MRHRTRKSSAHVTLVLLGAAALTGCGQPPDSGASRRQYATKQDCVADWGDPQDCAEETLPQRDGTSRRVYIGGGSSGGGTWGRGSGGGTHPGGGTSRGGFGSSGAAHGAGAS